MRSVTLQGSEAVLRQQDRVNVAVSRVPAVGA